MFRETIVHKWDVVTIHSRLLYIIPRKLNTRYCFYRTSRDHKQHRHLFSTIECKTLLGLPPSWKFYTAISSVIDLSNKFVDWKCFGDGWCLMDAFRLNYFIRFWQVHSNNRWHKFRGSIRKFFMCGPQSGLSLLFRKWCFWWFHLRYPLGLCHGVPHCRTSTMTYSRTLFLLIVEK